MSDEYPLLKAGTVLVNRDTDYRETVVIIHAHQQNDRYWLGLDSISKTKKQILKDWKPICEQSEQKKEIPTGKTPIKMEDIKQGTPMLVLNEYSGEWHSVKLKHVHSEDGDYRYHCVNGGAYKAVKFNPDEWIVWFGGEPPLPEGVEVEVMYRGKYKRKYPVDIINWKHLKDITDQYPRPSDVIAYRVVGLMKGYRYPWE